MSNLRTMRTCEPALSMCRSYASSCGLQFYDVEVGFDETVFRLYLKKGVAQDGVLEIASYNYDDKCLDVLEDFAAKLEKIDVHT